MKMVKIIVCVCLALFCLIYGAVVYGTGSGTGFFLFWILLGLLFVFGAAGLLGKLWMLLPTIAKRILVVFVALGGISFFVVEGMILSCFQRQVHDSLDYLIVLGAQVREDGPSLVLTYRLDKATEYLAAHPDTKCIVSGGQGFNEPFSEAEGMKQYLLEKGIEASRILLEDQSENTTQNISFCRKLVNLDGKRVGIVTNNFHLFRALHIARKQGLKEVEGIAADSSLYFLPNNMMREFFGVVKDF